MSLNRVWLSILVALFVSVGFVDSSFALSPLEQTLIQEHSLLDSNGYQKWEWMKNDCANCDILLLPTHEEVRTEKVRLFIHALVAHKAELQELYGVHGAEYNLLAHMSVGILGRESLFFTSKRYRLKEAMPWAVRLAKIIEIYLEGSDRNPSNNSRGPTQIKIVPTKVAERFGVTPDNLYIPENAALATMGYLIEALGELKRRVVINKLDFVTPDRYVDYLPYIYFGRTKAIVQNTATPESNSYVQDMKRYMSWIEVYERNTNLPLH
ncbi:hypothetical protein [Bdellovibrio svalbardensis]|uniref:Transglycosylase SLT domain-containing protein n=1 Tax=Bdellovibrio svalbardensis TaxID=2972972 RepID=A0ABT6DJV1_9BACT|nr:hypothetical protein [Bdellovibrio svalbardensis]MDG0817150.1 hypothetical protein [Bdellovibrio svalbardensis]